MGDGDWVGDILTPAVDSPGVVAERAEDRARRLWSRGFLVAGLAAGAALVSGPLLGYLVLDPFTRHSVILLGVCLALLLVAAILAPLKPGWRVVVRTLAVIGLVLALAFVATFGPLLAFFGDDRYPSPDGRSILVVSEGADMIDPIWYVSVQQSSPLLARTWDVGCFDGDDPDSGFASSRWVSSSAIELVSDSGRTYRIDIDPRNSRPSTTIDSGCPD